MRTYYVFNINRETSILSKESPYMLYKSFESIYHSDKDDYYMASNLYEQLAIKFNRSIINQKILNTFKDNDYYTYVDNEHKYYNKYKDEICNIKIKNSYMIVTTNASRIKLLNDIKGYNLFVCDFNNKDYFWLNEICC